MPDLKQVVREDEERVQVIVKGRVRKPQEKELRILVPLRKLREQDLLGVDVRLQ